MIILLAARPPIVPVLPRRARAPFAAARLRVGLGEVRFACFPGCTDFAGLVLGAAVLCLAAGLDRRPANNSSSSELEDPVGPANGDSVVCARNFSMMPVFSKLLVGSHDASAAP